MHMPGRGDNNKSGSSGRGASKQSNQGFGQAGGGRREGEGAQTGNRPSVPQRAQQDSDSQRNQITRKEKKS